MSEPGLRANIAFRNLDASPVIRSLIERRADGLRRFASRILRCDVLVDAQRQRPAGPILIEVSLSIPGRNVSVARHMAQDGKQHDLSLAVNRAFDAAEEALKRRGDAGSAAATGKVGACDA